MTSPYALAAYEGMADALERGPQNYGGDAYVASLRAYRRHHPDARLTYVDGNGICRWLTAAQARVHAIVTREADRDGGLITMKSIAAEACVSVPTVSRVITKLSAWSVIGAITVRGRNGGVYLFRRAVGDTLGRYATAAKAKLHQAKVRVYARLLRRYGKLSPVIRGLFCDIRVKHLFELTPFAREVMYERARLAIADPEGEDQAVVPTDRKTALEQMDMFRPSVRTTTTGTDLADALGCDRSRASGRVPCPAHGEGKKPTLSYKWTAEGGLLLHCFSGCDFEEIRRAALG